MFEMEECCPKCHSYVCSEHMFGDECIPSKPQQMPEVDIRFLSDSCGMLPEDINTFTSIDSINIHSLYKLGEPCNKLKTANMVAIIKRIKERNDPIYAGHKPK
jgi:hypothetical protein